MARSTIYLHFGPCAEILLPSFFMVLVVLVVDEIGPAAAEEFKSTRPHHTTAAKVEMKYMCVCVCRLSTRGFHNILESVLLLYAY